MFSRSYEYNPNSYQSKGYGANQGYGNDSASYTNLLPQTYSNPYSYHYQPEQNLNNQQNYYK